MATLADVLDCLNAAELKHILDTFDIASPNRKALAVMRQAILDEGSIRTKSCRRSPSIS